MTRSLPLVLVALLFAAPAMAQTPAPAAGQTFGLAAGMKRVFDGVKRNFTEAAEKVPEAEYAFRPTPDVRTMGELFAHVANGQFNYCSIAKGEPNPNKEDIEKTKKTKAEIVAALKASNDYCDAVYTGTTDQSATELVKQGQNMVARAAVLATNASHTNEHYGNVVTYMRLKGMVPPSTERTQTATRPSGR